MGLFGILVYVNMKVKNHVTQNDIQMAKMQMGKETN